ncbi:zinc-binding dehydrogenase [Streptomyces sp. NPDC058268]|uniref:zinc-binding dehydrogenase n=1 Tax=Streptomyces sp. NPDC058268 TaxID=3346413 RepID=UPI0036E8E2F6
MRGANATCRFVYVSPGRAKIEALGRLVDEGRLRPVIGAVLPLADIARAHALLEGGSGGVGRGRPRGKIAVAVHPPGRVVARDNVLVLTRSVRQDVPDSASLDACRYGNMMLPWHEQRRRRTSTTRSQSRSAGISSCCCGRVSGR